jgi:hypothetical protein
MLVNFNQMPQNSRIWIYQANQPFSLEIKSILENKLNDFISNWESHGAPLKASWSIFYDLFLIIAVDEDHYAASGCSIDKSVHLVKDLENELGTELLSKNYVAVLEGSSIATVTLKDLKNHVSEGKIKPDSVVFNNLIPTLGELDNNWRVPAEKTWVSRYFNK